MFLLATGGRFLPVGSGGLAVADGVVLLFGHVFSSCSGCQPPDDPEAGDGQAGTGDGMICPEIRELIAGRRFQRSLIVDIVPHLPAEDATLDGWIEQAIVENDQSGFFYVVLAALVAGRPVDARHLAKGTRLITHDSWVGVIAWQCQGEVAEQLVAAVQTTTLLVPIRVAALFAAAVWCREKRGGAMPQALITEARFFARLPKLSEEARLSLYALASYLNDEGLNAVLLRTHAIPIEGHLLEGSHAYADALWNSWEGPIVEQIKMEPRPQAIEGYTMRRAVARISRNDPCPCGSGRKYKRCCVGKDQERLRHSTHVSGKTVLELAADREAHLTEESLMKLPGHEIARLDPLRIAPNLQSTYFLLLIGHSFFERAAEAFELLGYDPAVEERLECWKHVLVHATSKGDRKIVRRLANWHPDTAKGLNEHLYVGTGIMLLEEEPAKMLEMVTAASWNLLDGAPVEDLVGFPRALLMTQFNVLGIYVARSMIPLLPRKEAIEMLDAIFRTRDALNLPPDDPYSDVLDKRFAEEPVDTGKDAGALREAQRRLEAKAAEVRRIKEELEKLRREVERREKKEVEPALQKSAPSVVEEEKLRELRRKVADLKSVLQGRHEERITLRRELQEAHTDLESLRQKQNAPAPAADNALEAEEKLTLPGEVSGNQPVRVLEFPRKFAGTLADFPKPVARAAMTMLGRLAGGEPAAYVGVVRLKEHPETLRQRIGIDHRLLFRLHPDCVEVVDLINRRDLERRIKAML